MIDWMIDTAMSVLKWCGVLLVLCVGFVVFMTVLRGLLAVLGGG